MGQTVKHVLFALIRSEINGSLINDDIKNLITTETLPDLFKLSKRHDLAHLVCDALVKNGFLSNNTDIEKRFLYEYNMAIYRHEQIHFEFEQICSLFENCKIPFIPLKGSVIRGFYPETWMRTSCDIDILVSKDNLNLAIKELENNLNYKFESVGNHDAHLFSESGVHLELHYSLGSAIQKGNLVDCWKNVKPTDKYQKEFIPEIFYLYHVAHMAGHFKLGGCGVRSVLDLWILKQKLNFEEEKLKKLLNEENLLTFANETSDLSCVWFGDAKQTQWLEELGNYILYAGMYGDMKNRVAIQVDKKGSKFKYLMGRLFLPYKQLKYQYPLLQKCCLLYPFYSIKRWFKLLGKESRDKMLLELKETTNGEQERKDSVNKIIKRLKL